jgi:pimeloyl-ACP methyl ester carboxylesterase
MTTHTLDVPGAALVYDVHGALPTKDGRPPLLMIGQPMDAGGFTSLASYFPDRTVVAYDPRGLGRSTRTDGRLDNTPEVQAADVHALIRALDAGPVDMFASSGGAVTALVLVAAHPGDVVTLVAHEPPLIPVLPDAHAAERARSAVRDAYAAKGWGAGMAAFRTRSAEDGVPEPPRRVPRRRVRPRRPTGGVRAPAARGPRRGTLMIGRLLVSGPG